MTNQVKEIQVLKVPANRESARKILVGCKFGQYRLPRVGRISYYCHPGRSTLIIENPKENKGKKSVTFLVTVENFSEAR